MCDPATDTKISMSEHSEFRNFGVKLVSRITHPIFFRKGLSTIFAKLLSVLRQFRCGRRFSKFMRLKIHQKSLQECFLWECAPTTAAPNVFH